MTSVLFAGFFPFYLVVNPSNLTGCENPLCETDLDKKYNFLLQQKEGYILVKGPHSKKIYQRGFFHGLAKMGSNRLAIYLSEQERYWKWQIRFMCIHQEQVCKTSFDIKVYLLGGIIIIITISSKQRLQFIFPFLVKNDKVREGGKI